MNSKAKRLLLNVAYAVGVIIAILVAWYVVSLSVNSELVAPSPFKVLELTFSLLGKGTTYLALLSTLLRSFVAFVASVAFALGLCLFAGVFPSSKPAVDNVVTIFRAVPTMSVILITMILSPSTIVPVVVAFLVAFPITYSAFTREIYADKNLSNMCLVYDVTRADKIRYILLPQIGKAVIPQVRDTLPLCLKVVIAGEALSLPKNALGQQMYVAKINLDTASVLALTILALAFCFVIQGVTTLCQKKLAS